MSRLRVAIVHDWFVGGGAELVVEQLHKMYPDAAIYTSYISPQWREQLKDARIVTGFLQHWPFSKLRKFFPLLRIWWFSHLKFDGYDLVISSSGAEAKGIKTGKNTLHVNYCHAPTHYYWSRYDEYMDRPGFGTLDPLARLGLKLLVNPLRSWDKKAAQRPDYMIANSNHIKSEIKKYYGRESVVIHPPVDVDAFISKAKHERQGFLIAGRQTPYKRFDLAVKTCSTLGLPLTVVGKGPDNSRLKKMAGETVLFALAPTKKDLARFFQSAEAFIFPGVDDFGITPLEAMAAGTPVIAYGQGGALDYVNNKTGLIFDEQTVESLGLALEKFRTKKFKSEDLVKQAEQFSPANFRRAMSDFINSKLS